MKDGSSWRCTRRLHTPETTLAVLDEYEGDEFERVIVNNVWIYRYRETLPENSRIQSGDFCAP